jgi:hypothetical protein
MRETGCSGKASALPSVFQKQEGEHATVPQRICKFFGKIKSLPKVNALGLVLMVVALVGAPKVAFAQTDEIQVYDAAIEEQGKFNLMLHSNFTPRGHKTPAFPDAIISNHAFVGVAEWAYGVTDWFEQGLYLPLYSFSSGRGGSINGFKIRELFVRPHADDHTFFYGVNFEFSVNARYWDTRRITSEVRPIVGLHLHPVDIVFNPIVDTNYTGGFGNLEFVPSTRIAYNLNPKWAVAVEEYSDFGPLRHFLPAHDQFQQVWGVFDHTSKIVNIEAGAGVGVTSGADKFTLKLMLSRDLN